MVSEIVRNFQPDAFGVLVVGERSDKTLWCVDGQTRLKAAVKLGIDEVPCLTFESSGKEHEASLFRLLNTQTNQSKLQKMKALLCEGDANTHDLVAIVERSGFKIGFDGEKTWPHIRSIVPVEKAYERGTLQRVLSIVSKAWSSTRDIHALQVPVLGGLQRFISLHGDIVNDDELASRLQKFAVQQLVSQCEARKMQGGSREDAMREVIVQVWNKGRRVRIEPHVIGEADAKQ
jgi:hypothetical protein